MLRRAAVRCAAGPAVPSAPLRGRIPAATMLEPGVAAGSPELDTGGGHTQRNTHHARRWASVMPLPPPPLQPKLGAGCHLWARRDLMQSGHCTPVTLWRGAQRSISGGNSARGRDGGGDELAQFLLHGKMVLQTATVALETGDAEKIRGAKVTMNPLRNTHSTRNQTVHRPRSLTITRRGATHSLSRPLILVVAGGVL